MDIKELLGFLECEKMERFQKVDSSVKVDCHDFAAAKQAKRSFFRKSRNDKVGGWIATPPLLLPQRLAMTANS